MKNIENAAIAGMGALGLLFGQMIAENIGSEHLCFVMNSERRKRHSSDIYEINGKEVSYRMLCPEEVGTKTGLIIIATKYSGLREAAALIRPLVGEDTTIVSLLNGISSEEILAETYPADQIIDTVAIGMDAVRDGAKLTYKNTGKWQIGIRSEGQKERFENLTAFLDRAKIPYEVCADIRHAMWKKFMMNDGINQTCMVYETDYAGALREGEEPFEKMKKVMHEVIDISAAEGINLTEEDFEGALAVFRTLNPVGYPSMRQDAMAGRRTEVELFAGEVLRIAKRHGIPVPANQEYYERILEMEREYS